LLGQKYQIHGIANSTYNLITGRYLQLNSRFVFLSAGQCPIIYGYPATNCYSHPGSYLGSIGIQQWVEDTIHTVRIESGNHRQGFSLIEVDGIPLKVGQAAEFGSISTSSVSSNSSSVPFLSVYWSSSHLLKVSTPLFSFTFENSDMFINQAVITNVALNQLQCHGLFGQTYQNKTYPNSVKYIEGDVDDYLVLDDDDLFGSQCLYNRFIRK